MEEKIKNKAWWRFLKVVYVLTWIFGFLVIGTVTYLSRPYKTESYVKLGFKCNSNGKSWEFEPNGTFYDLKRPRLEQSDIENIKKTCAYGNNWHKNEDFRIEPVPDEKFSLHYVYNENGSLGGMALAFVLSSIGVFVVIEGVKSIVLYVAGISIWRGVLLFSLAILVAMRDKENKEN